MPLEDKFIEELRLESLRDLVEAEKILENNGHIEHVAWLCEQSYEKLIKSVYAYFKLKIQSGNVRSVYDKMYASQHYGSYKLIINMFREIFGSFRKSFDSKPTQIVSTASESEKGTASEFMNFVNNTNFSQLNKELEHKCKGVEETIGKCLSSNHAFKDFIDIATEKSLRKSLNELNFEATIKDVTDKLPTDPRFKSTDPAFRKILEQVITSGLEDNIKFYAFMSYALLLGRWVLPHASMPRYPILEYNFDNLVPYREKSDELKPFFKLIIDETRSLYPRATDFIEKLHFYKNLGMIETTP
jgi:hypothetical protein